ncbi:ectonucleotide pyrophosphatase/phosphodiesterase [Pinirhizobacter sp.]|jgi:predicted AlkP superfamily pyrophosphatase or phosphodiesterase|uniref:alkaline phosphatase family protein n=1 Tax=Pinirhizobacter sp. TaxID=2950432 RepID=UPI002F41E67D
MKNIPCLLLAVALLSGCATTPPTPAPAPAKERIVLLVSIDGYRADYLDRHLSPTLEKLAATGVHATAMQPSFPSLTFPNHYAIVTGKVPDHSGIVNNTMVDPALGRFSMAKRAAVADGRWWEDAEPVWVTAERHGIRAATMFWPGSEAAIEGIRPTHYLPWDGKLKPDARVDQLLAWLDVPPAQRPRLATLYFDAVDHQGHKFGPDSKEVDQAIAETDHVMAHLIAGLGQRNLLGSVDLIVVSDHGMAATPANQVILVDDIVDPSTVDVVATGTLPSFNPLAGHDFTRAQAALLAPHEHMACWRKADIPARFDYGHHERVPAIVCLPDVGWQVTTKAALAKRKDPMSLGQHGYDNADPSMRALFIANGPSFGRGVTIGEFPNVDVYDLVMHLLGLQPLPNDGSLAPLQPALAAPAQSP